MGATATTPQLKLSPYNNQDSDGNAMLEGHAYKAQRDGFVSLYDLAGAAGAGMIAWVGQTSNPTDAGIKVQCIHRGAANEDMCYGFPVAKNEYFEIDTTANPIILWKNNGTLLKPIDFN